MSKYIQRSCYHFVDFCNPNTTYAKHVDDLMVQLDKHIGSGFRTAHEVGCGEGLIMDQISKRLGWEITGNDTDEVAISMARRLCPDLMFDHGRFSDVNEEEDVILFCDCLEHIKDWREQIENAKELSGFIVIAVPDRHDPHGERDFAPDFADAILSGWEIAHRATRHARHLTIWKKP